MTLWSLELTEAGAHGYAGTFLLRIRDLEREVEIPFTFEADGQEARLAGSLTIDRLEYGLGAPSMILADEVAIHLEAWLVRAVGSPQLRAAQPGR